MKQLTLKARPARDPTAADGAGALAQGTSVPLLLPGRLSLRGGVRLTLSQHQPPTRQAVAPQTPCPSQQADCGS